MTRSRRSHVELSSWYAATTTETQTMDPEGNITTTAKYTGEVKMTAHGKRVIAGSAVAAAGVFAAEIALLVELLDD